MEKTLPYFGHEIEVSELYRLSTFRNFPLTAKMSISSVKLAESGFVYIGKEDETLCVFCLRSKSDWKEGDDVNAIHSLISPECPMVTRRDCSNQPIHSVKESTNNQNSAISNNITNYLKSFSHDIDNDGVTVSQSVTISNVTLNRKANEPLRNHNSDKQAAENVTPSDSNSSTNKAKRQEFQLENKRLESFTKWPADHHLTPTFVAKAGFYYAGYQDCVRCFFCGGGLKNWKLEDDIWVEHARWFPKCGFLKQKVGGDFIKAVSELNDTHENISQKQVLDRLDKDYAKKFIALQESSVKTLCTEKNLASNKEDKYSNAGFQSDKGKQSSSAKWKKSQINVQKDDYSELGVVKDKPKRGEMALQSDRLKSFNNNWPPDHHLKPKDLADAGFYFTGQGDCARCFYCGGGLRNWEKDDDIYIEHVRWFPKCSYITQIVGQRFTDAVGNLNRTKDTITIDMVCKLIGREQLSFHPKFQLINNPAVKTVIEKGNLDEKEVLNMATELYNQNKKFSSDDLIKKLHSRYNQAENISTTVDTESLRIANNELREQLTCKICMENNVEIVFIPCGHLMSCTVCSAVLSMCPICRETIEGKSRVIMS